MKNRWWRYGLWALVAVAFFTAAHVAFWQRVMVEKDFRQVQLAVNYDEISSLSGYQGLTAPEGLGEFKTHGVSGVVLREPIVDELRINGDIQVLSGQELANLVQAPGSPRWLTELPATLNIIPGRTYLITFNRELFTQLAAHMSAKLTGVSQYDTGEGTYVIETVAPYMGIRDLGVGFTQASLADVQAAGLETILQIRTWPGAAQQSINEVFGLYRDIPNVAVVMFNDDTLPGYPQLLPILAEEIRKMDVPITQVEFFPQRGLTKLGILLDKKVVRLHTIAQNEMKRLSPNEALDRYTLAAAERNHRILLVRPLLTGGDLIQENLNFMDQLVLRLQNEGLGVGTADKLPPVPVSRELAFLIGLGVLAGGLLLLEKLVPGRYLPIVGLAGLAVWTGAIFLAPEFGRKLMALGAVIVFPTLALLRGVSKEGKTPGAAVLTFICISLFSLLGALFTVGLLADAGFMLKLDQFFGVKLAHVIPLVIVMLYFPLITTKGGELLEKVKGLMESPLKLGVALAAGFMAVAVTVYVLRTGNEGMAVSGLELQFRSMLDQLLGVRPRTKEFLLGHPALLLLLIYGYRDNRFLPLLLLGAIGQASLVNTFAHIHTPLVVSLLRAFNGIWLGIVLGLAVFLVIKLATRWRRDSNWLKF